MVDSYSERDERDEDAGDEAQAELSQLRQIVASLHDCIDQTDPGCPIGVALTLVGSTVRPRGAGLSEDWQTIAKLRQHVTSDRDGIHFLRDEWTLVGARGCPACLYIDGVFQRSCKLHEYLDQLQRTIKFLRYYEIPDDAIDIFTKNLCERTEGTELEALADDCVANIKQLRKERDEACKERDDAMAHLAENPLMLVALDQRDEACAKLATCTDGLRKLRRLIDAWPKGPGEMAKILGACINECLG